MRLKIQQKKKGIKNIFKIPVTEQAMLLNSVPKGSGFLRMKDIFGNPPVLSFRGRQADIVSSSSLITEAATVFALLLLNSAIHFDTIYHGSSLELSMSEKACGKKAFMSSNLLKAICGDKSIGDTF